MAQMVGKGGKGRARTVIPVAAQPEPRTFDTLVRQPGNAALAAGEKPLPAYWQKCLPDLYKAYNGICAYLAHYIPKGVGTPSADHFIAKSRRKELAYEWSNYRLACLLMNARKNKFEDVLDPFEIEDDWFHLELTFLRVYPNPSKPEDVRNRVQETIDRLKLNDPECVEGRASYYNEYLAGHVDLDFLERRSPFVAREHKRQQLMLSAKAKRA